MEGGPPGFGPRFTGAVLLRNVYREAVRFRIRDDCPLWCAVPRASANTRLCNSRRDTHIPDERPTTPDRQRVPAYTCQVWADPLSLATTRGVSVDFLSSGYLDVSVRPLVSACLCIQRAVVAALPAPGFPIRESTGQRLFNASPWLIAVVHALLRLLMPRHPPCALLILTVISSGAVQRTASKPVIPNFVWP